MKNQLSTFIASCAIVCGFIATASAQNAPSMKPAMPATQATSPKITPEQITEMKLNKMKADLNLTPEQLPKVKTLLQRETTVQAAAQRSNNTQMIKDYHEKMMTDMGKILTPEQMTKYKQMGQKQMPKMPMGEAQPMK